MEPATETQTFYSLTHIFSALPPTHYVDQCLGTSSLVIGRKNPERMHRALGGELLDPLFDPLPELTRGHLGRGRRGRPDQVDRVRAPVRAALRHRRRRRRRRRRPDVVDVVHRLAAVFDRQRIGRIVGCGQRIL